MAKATKTTEQVQKVIYEDKDVVTVTMSVEEAHAVHSVLWLIEMTNMDDPSFLAMKRVQDAIGVAMDFPISQFRSDKSNCYNNESSVYIYARN